MWSLVLDLSHLSPADQNISPQRSQVVIVAIYVVIFRARSPQNPPRKMRFRWISDPPQTLKIPEGSQERVLAKRLHWEAGLATAPQAQSTILKASNQVEPC